MFNTFFFFTFTPFPTVSVTQRCVIYPECRDSGQSKVWQLPVSLTNVLLKAETTALGSAEKPMALYETSQVSLAAVALILPPVGASSRDNVTRIMARVSRRKPKNPYCRIKLVDIIEQDPVPAFIQKTERKLAGISQCKQRSRANCVPGSKREAIWPYWIPNP